MVAIRFVNCLNIPQSIHPKLAFKNICFSEEPALIYMGEDNNDQFLPHNPESAPTATNRDRYEQLAVYKHSSVPIRVCKAHERASRSVIALASATTTDLS